MKRTRIIIAAALLTLPLFVMSGCSSDRIIYSSVLQEDTNMVEGSMQSDAIGDRTSLQEVSEVQEATGLGVQEQETETEEIGYVFLCGAVNQPGVYPVEAGTRLYSVIELAGGFSQDADTQWLNLASTVYDAQRIYVYTKEETSQMLEQGLSPESSMETAQQTTTQEQGKININTADAAALMTLPGIGEAKAQAIIAYRQQHGLFAAIEDLQQISGIKNAVFSKIKDLITV